MHVPFSRSHLLQRAAVVVVSTMCCATFGAGAASAAPGALDTTFGTAGVAATDFGRGSSSAYSTVVQPDGKIVAVGQSTGRTGAFAVTRYDADGTLDGTFGEGGRHVTHLAFGAAKAVALAPDGKIVVAGTGGGFAGSFALIRLQTDGSPDPTFSGDGQLVIDSQLGNGSGASGVAVQSDGRIVVVGSVNNQSGETLAVARLNVDGTFDTGFSGDGKAFEAPGGFTSSFGVEIQAGGRIVTAAGAGEDVVVYRYGTDGTRDATFGQNGLQRAAAGGSSQLGSLALGPNGTVVVTRGLDILRTTGTGDLDPTFGGDGLVTTTGFGKWASIVQDDGKIVVGGSGSSDFQLARYDADGSLDGTFAGDGQTETDFGADGFGRLRDLALQPDGRIVAVGTGGDRDGADFAVTRHTATGLADTTFSQDGRLTTTFPGADSARDVAVQANGRIVAVGRVGAEGDDLGVARSLPDGSPDLSFSGDGRQTVDFDQYYEEARAVDLQPDGKIVVAGSANADFALARFNADGTPDASFSGDGKVLLDVGFWAQDGAQDVVVQPDGKILAAGGVDNRFGLVRFNADGTLDTTFSGDGKLQTTFEGTASGLGGVARSVVVRSNGTIVAVGTGGTSDSGIAVARYTADGTLDPTFDGDGRQQFRQGQFGQMRGAAAAVQPDGRVIVGASDGQGSYISPLLLRLTTTGALDQAFASDGMQSVPFAGVGNDLRGIAVGPDGTIAMVGAKGFYNASTDVIVAKLRPDGELDQRFSGDGMAEYDFGGSDVGSAVTVESNGDLVVAGSVTRESIDFGVVRIDGGDALPPLDVQAPSISITRPTEGSRFVQGEAVSSAFSCEDAAGSVSRCSGPASVDTGTVGSRTFTVEAEDAAGNRTAKTVAYVVVAPPVHDVPSDPAPTDQPPAPAGPTEPGGPAAPPADPVPAPGGTQAPAPSAQQTPTGALKLPGTLPVKANGSFVVTVTCPKGQKCGGAVRVTAKVRSGKSGKTTTVVLATGTLKAGSPSAALKLTAAGKKALRAANGRLKASVSVTAKGAKKPGTMRTVTLRRAKSK